MCRYGFLTSVCSVLNVSAENACLESPSCQCSLCPTFAAVALFINNARWDGVPFLLKAGKALESRRTEIRVQFRHVPGNLFRDRLGLDLDRATNELVRCHSCLAAWSRMLHRPVPGLWSLLCNQTKVLPSSRSVLAWFAQDR